MKYSLLNLLWRLILRLKPPERLRIFGYTFVLESQEIYPTSVIKHIMGLTSINPPNRKEEVVFARQMVCYYLTKEKGYSSQDAADIFKQTHATVLSGNRKINNLIDIKDKKYFDYIEQFCKVMDIEL